jgi:hypothetical protein
VESNTPINKASVTAVNIKHFAELDVNINLDLIGDLFDKAYTRSWYRGDRLDSAQIVALTKLNSSFTRIQRFK